MDGYSEHKWMQVVTSLGSKKSTNNVPAVADDNEEPYWALKHWINDENISPSNKIKNFDKHIRSERERTQNEILNLLEKHYYVHRFEKCACQQENNPHEANSFTSWQQHIKGLLQ